MDDAPLVQGPAEPSRATEPGPEPIEPDVDEGSAALDAGDDAAVRQASLFDAPAGERSAPAPAPRPAPARPRIGPVPDETVPRAVPDARPSGALDTAAAQRAREEALSRAGDLRSRIVRWMLAPDTPVIVSIEAVQAAFELPADVARDIVEGILESPPPSLRLTRVRADLLRVSRITVEQDA